MRAEKLENRSGPLSVFGVQEMADPAPYTFPCFLEMFWRGPNGYSELNFFSPQNETNDQTTIQFRAEKEALALL